MNIYIILSILLLIIITIIKYNNKKEGLETKLNLCFYTYFYGSDNNISYKIPPIPSSKYKCYYYTNNKILLEKLKNTKWIGVYDSVNTTDDMIDSAMKSKRVKALPQLYSNLNTYDYTVMYDSKYMLINELVIEELIETYCINNNYALLIRKHPFINDVFGEFNESLKQERYLIQKEKMLNYINKQLNNGLKEKTGNHSATGFIIRNMKHPEINNINNTWYTHILDCGIECQISFFFVTQLYIDYIYTFDNNVCFNNITTFLCD
jgi:hypothetical protein